MYSSSQTHSFDSYKGYLKILSALCLFLLINPLYAQKALHVIQNIDLSNNAILDIYQDQNGYMWIGTYDGLNLYNGKSNRVFRFEPNNKNTLCSNIIHKISYGGTDHLWISTSMGLNKFTLKDHNVTESYPEYPICTNIASDSLGNTLLIKRKNFISWYSPNTNQFYDIYAQGINEENTSLLFYDNFNSFSLITKQGHLKKIQVHTKSFPPSYSIQEIQIHDTTIEYAHYTHHNQTLYLVDAKHQLFSYHPQSGQKQRIANLNKEIKQYGPLSHIAPKDSLLYLAYKQGYLQTLNQSKSTLNLNVGLFCILPDRYQNILWLGTDGQGIQMYYDQPSRFKGLKLEDLPITVRNPVRAIFTEDENTIWFGTKGNGIIRIQNYSTFNNTKIPTTQITHFTEADNLSNNQVFCFRRSNYHPIIWIGTNGPGLSYYSFHEKKIYTLPSKINTPIQYVHSICEINDSTLWLATTGNGIQEVIIDKNGLRPSIKYIESFIPQKDKRICNEFHTMTYDSINNFLYLGSRGGYGLVRFNLTNKHYEFLSINHTDNKAIGDVLCMCQIGDSIVYLGASSGMTQMNIPKEKAKHYTKLDGIKNDMIHGILEDTDHCIWLSTNKGLTKYNPQNQFFHNYEGEELPVTEFSDDAYWKCPYTERLFFGGINGLVWIELRKKEKTEEYKPQLYFYELKMNNKTHSLYEYNTNHEKSILIPPTVNTFTVSFVAPDYLHGENYEYAYMLKGHNNEWIKLQKENEVSFTQLPYGKYTLHVRYKNDVLNSNIQEYLLPIHILSPWYLTTEAFCIYLLLLLGVVYYIIHQIRKRLLRRQAIITKQIKEEQKEKLYKAKLNFFANITHEFCTPLTLINGVNSYISDSAQQSKNPKLEKYAQILQENVKSLNELIHEILDFQQIKENDFIQPNIQRIAISDLINKQCESFRPIAEENEIDFTVSTSNVPTYWNTDYSSLKKIIRNLISNAFKYTEEKGKISIIAKIEDEKLQITIYNSGKGIDPNNLHKIFDRHQILGDIDCNNYTSSTSQHGLGLYICYNLVHLLQGEIKVESQKNAFTTFNIILPPLELSSQPAPLPEQVKQKSDIFPPALQINQRKTDKCPLILIIDDNQDIVWLIKDTLSKSYSIKEAYSAEEGLEFIKQQKPSLIITDIMMPNMDGLEFIKQIKSNKFTKHIPVIVVSAKISEQDQAKGLDLGANLYLPKPFSPLVLLSSVNRLIENKQEMKQFYHSPESAYEQYEEQMIHQADKEFIDEITTILQENISQENIRPEFIADKLGINTRTLYRRFKKISPLTPSDFIKDYRLTYAAQLLITTNMNVQEIIYQVGISNKSYFYREFSEKYNMTPRQYRQQKK